MHPPPKEGQHQAGSGRPRKEKAGVSRCLSMLGAGEGQFHCPRGEHLGPLPLEEECRNQPTVRPCYI